jgi:hypothetical protein
VSRFRPPPPPALRSGRYAHAYHEVKRVGAAESRERPADRGDIARFYGLTLSVDIWHPAAAQLSAARGKTLAQNARIFALVAMATFDSLLVAWDGKYHHQLWRPVTAIRAGDDDHHPRTEPDPAWTPLVPPPAHPSYPSAHASAAGGAIAVLERHYGKNGFEVALENPKIPEVTPRYTGWMQIARDIDDARIYGGVHFRFDQEAGARLGRQVGTFIANHKLRPVRR